MTLNSKCNAGDICLVLGKKTKPSVKFFETMLGGAIRPCYYETAYSYILTPATDKKDPRIQSILEAITLAKEVLILAEEQGKSIIIPVAEQQNVCHVPRNHWVTLHYNPKLKTCTLIDSRHWLLSYLYPTHPMFEMFTQGLASIGMDANGIIFDHIYQNVQFNDIFCGAWTLMNSLTLAGALEDSIPPESMEVMKTLFWEVEEVNIVNQIIDFSGCPSTPKLAPLSGRFQQSLIFFGLSSYSDQVEDYSNKNNEYTLE